MAEKCFPTLQELRGFGIDADVWRKFINGEIGEANQNQNGVDVGTLLSWRDEALRVGAIKPYQTRDAMNADAAQPVGTWAAVLDDSTASNNGYYIKIVGGWKKTSLQPASVDSPAFVGTPIAPFSGLAYENPLQIANLNAVLALTRVSRTVAITAPLTTLTGEQARMPVISFTGTLAGDSIVEIPTSEGALTRILRNATAGGHAVTVRHVGQSSGGVTLSGSDVVVAISNGVVILLAGVSPAQMRDVQSALADVYRSPAFTGTPTAPNAGPGYENSSQIATINTVNSLTRNHRTIAVTSPLTTLTLEQSRFPVVTFTGALTADTVVEIPTDGAGLPRIFRVATTGGYSVTVRHVGRTDSVVLRQGEVAGTISNGTSVFRVGVSADQIAAIDAALEAIQNSQGLKQIKYTGAYDPDRIYQEGEAAKFNGDYYYAHGLTATYKNQVKNPLFNAVSGTSRYGWTATGTTGIEWSKGKWELSINGDKASGALIIGQTIDHNVPASKGQVWSASIEVENKSSSNVYIRVGILVTGSTTFYSDNVLVPALGKVVVKQEGVTLTAPNSSAVRITVNNGTGQIIPSGTVLVFRKPMLNMGENALDYFDGSTQGTIEKEYSWAGEINNSVSLEKILSAPSLIGPPGSDSRWVKYVGDADAAAGGLPMHIFNPVKTQKGTQEIPSFYTLDRTIGFNVGSSNLNQTFDDGETWELLHAFAGSQTDSVRQLENGELFVTASNSSGSYAWVSSGFASGGPVTFTKTLDAHSKFIKWVSGWSIFDDGNLITMIDYGGKAGMQYAGEIVQDGQNARFAYLSLDFGKTWKTIFDLNKWVVDNGYGTPDDDDVMQGRGVHCHGIAYDKWWNRIWITFGDNTTIASINSIGGTCYSDDFGETWTAANWGKDSQSESPTNSRHQLVGIWPMPECILFGTDSAPNGVHRIERSQGKYPAGEYTINVAYAYSDEPMLTHLCQSITQARYIPDQPAVFGFGAEGYSRKSFVVATRDGFDFKLLWESAQPNASGRGIRSVCGPTRMGNMILKEIDTVSGASVISQLKGPYPVY